MRVGTVCSGIGAPECAWKDLGWEFVFCSEIEPFPSAVLAYHYPEVPNFGDFTRIATVLDHADEQWQGLQGAKGGSGAAGDDIAGGRQPRRGLRGDGKSAINATDLGTGSIDVLVGGTPCQDFSVAGLRAGMDGQRGQLTVEFAYLAGRLRPKWLVWENVPGILSIDEGRAFGIFLRLLGELGYGFAYRILDAQYYGVAQRRRRVFVVGCLGDWRRAAAVLFERESLCGYPAPRRKTPEGTAPTTEERTESDSAWPEVAMPVMSRDYKGPRNFQDGGLQNSVVTFSTPAIGDIREDDIASAMTGNSGHGGETQNPAFVVCGYDGDVLGNVTGTLRTGEVRLSNVTPSLNSGGGKPGEGYSAIAVRTANTGANGHGVAENVSHTLDGAKGQAVAFTERTREDGRNLETQSELAYALTNPRSGGRTHSRQLMTPQMAVRRLTPRECERLQGFPDDYTLIEYKGQQAADGPRYKALGNAMAVPVMKWLGERILMVERVLQHGTQIVNSGPQTDRRKLGDACK